MDRTRGRLRRRARARERVEGLDRSAVGTLPGTAREDASVLLLGLEALADECWSVLAAAGISTIRVADTAAAIRALTDRQAQVVIVDARTGPALTSAVRARPELSSTHIIVGVALDSPSDLRAALDAGADDVIRVPFEAEVVAARVAAGLGAARLRAGEALLRSLVANIPGAVYRCVRDEDWTMEWLSDAFEEISGYPASDFIESAERTFASVIHPADREQVERSVSEAVEARRAFTLEYRIVRRDGEIRWVLERGRLQEADDGRRWLDGAIFDVTARHEAEDALRERALVEAQLAEVRASRARVIEAADRARRGIERDLHDGAQQRFVSIALHLQTWLAGHPEIGEDARAQLAGVLGELREGLSELRDLAQGLHPAVLSERGLARALTGLVNRATVPVELRSTLPEERLPMPVESAAYFTVCEGLTNIAKYAEADRAWVTIARRGDQLDVEVGDDGVGGAGFGAGSGLEGLRDRIEAVNGTLHVDSRPGHGTVLRARLPVAG